MGVGFAMLCRVILIAGTCEKWFHEPVQNSCVISRASVYQMGQDEVWRRRRGELILWYYESHRRKNDCPIRELVAVMMMIVLYFLHENVLWRRIRFSRGEMIWQFGFADKKIYMKGDFDFDFDFDFDDDEDEDDDEGVSDRMR